MPNKQFPSFDTSSGASQDLLRKSKQVSSSYPTPLAEVLQQVDRSFSQIHQVLTNGEKAPRRKLELLDLLKALNAPLVREVEDIVCSYISAEELVHISHAVYALFLGEIRACSGLKTNIQIDEIRLRVGKLLIPEVTFENKHRQYADFLTKYYSDKRGVWSEFAEYDGKKGKTAELLLIHFLRKLGKKVPSDLKFQGNIEIEVTRGAIVFYIPNEQDFAKIPGTVKDGLVCRGLYFGTSISENLTTGPLILVRSKKDSQEAHSIRKHELVHRDDVFLWNSRDKRFSVAHREILAFLAQGRGPQEIAAILCYEKGFYFPSDEVLKAARLSREEYKSRIQNYVKQAERIVLLYPHAGIYLLAVTPILQWESITLL